MFVVFAVVAGATPVIGQDDTISETGETAPQERLHQQPVQQQPAKQQPVQQQPVQQQPVQQQPVQQQPVEEARGEEASDPKASAPVAPAVARRAVQEDRTEIYYVPDKNGKLRPAFFDITFEELKKRISDLADPSSLPPAFTIDQFSATGRARDEFAELEMRVAVTNRLDSDDRWIRIPLRSENVILKADDKAVYDGPGEYFVRFDPQDGYIWWLRGGTNKQHQLTLNAIVPLEMIGEQRKLRLDVPRASVSQLTLNVSDPVIASASPGVALTSERNDQGQTEIQAMGVTGEFELTWRRQRPDEATRTATLETDGLQTIQVMGSQIRSQIDLRVQSFGKPFDQFRVQLPEGFRLISESPTGYTFAVEADGKADGKKDANDVKRTSKWVDVKLEELTTGPVEVRLVAEQIRRFGDWEREFQLAGFRVAGAVRESGHVVVQVRGDWIVRWMEDFNGRYDIRRVDDWPAKLPKVDVVAAFEYFRQPFSLRARVLSPKTRVAVEPQYVMDVSADHVVLSGQLKYQVRGAQIDHVTIDLPGWDFDATSIGPSDLVNVSQLVWSEAGQVHIPLARKTAGQFAIDFRARRSLRPGERALAVPLPIPQADAIGATTLAVVSADNVELTPQDQGDDEVSSPLPLSLELPKRQHEPYFYLYRHSEDVPDEYKADIEGHEPSLAVDVLTELDVARLRIGVEQRFEFEISYGRLDAVELVVPATVAALDDFSIIRDGQVLDIMPRADEAGKANAIYRVPLNNEIGIVLLSVQYHWGSRPPTGTARILNSVPLVTAHEAEYRSNRLELTSSGAVRSELLIEPWQAVDEASVPAVYVSDRPESEVRVVTGITEYSSNGGRSVDRAWLQTWLTSSGRHDRAVLRLRSREPTVALQLPARTAADSVDVRLNGKRVPSVATLEGLLQIEIPQLEADVVLDIRYAVDQQRAQWWLTEFVFPRFVGGANLREPLHWQLILPANEHLLHAPPNCLAAYEWKWQRLGWRRVPSADEADLAIWSGVADLEEVTDTATAGGFGERNVYLFRTRDLPDVLTVYSAPRALMVLVPAGLMLMLGYLLIYVPFFRRTAVVFTGIVLFAALAAIFPELALLVAQVATLGVVLSLLVVFLRYMLRASPPTHLLLQRSIESSVRQSTTKMFQTPGDVERVGSTATKSAPLGHNVPEPE